MTPRAERDLGAFRCAYCIGWQCGWRAAFAGRFQTCTKSSALAGLLAPRSARIDTPRRFKAARTELTRLAALARAELEPLQAFADALDDQARRMAGVGDDLETAALAALFLSEHLAIDQPDLARRFLQREMSLAATALKARGGQLERDDQAQAPRTLITAIQDVVLVALADWLRDAESLATNRRLPPIDASDIQHRLRTILRNLEP